jgi:hypothetical protein
MAEVEQSREEQFFVLGSDMKGGMLLTSIPRPHRRQSWTMGQRFTTAPTLPVMAEITKGYETATPCSYVDVPPIMSVGLYETLVHAGVTNIDAYDAVLRSEDGAVTVKGFVAFNLIGLVAAADLGASRFAAGSSSRHLDASFDSLVLDTERIAGLRMFRLAEFSSAVIVHRSIKAAIEAAAIPRVVFRKPAEFLS